MHEKMCKRKRFINAHIIIFVNNVLLLLYNSTAQNNRYNTHSLFSQ